MDDRDQLLESSLPATIQCEHYQEVRIGTKARAQTQAIPVGTVSVLTNVLFVGLKAHLLGHFFFFFFAVLLYLCQHCNQNIGYQNLSVKCVK